MGTTDTASVICGDDKRLNDKAVAYEILFIDEVQELSQENMILSYRAVSERKLFLPGTRKVRSLPLAAFTLVAATTNPEALPPSFKDRLNSIELTFYSAVELSHCRSAVGSDGLAV